MVATGLVVAARGREQAPLGGTPFLPAALGRVAAGGGVVVCDRTLGCLQISSIPGLSRLGMLRGQIDGVRIVAGARARQARGAGQ